MTQNEGSSDPPYTSLFMLLSWLFIVQTQKSLSFTKNKDADVRKHEVVPWDFQKPSSIFCSLSWKSNQLISPSTPPGSATSPPWQGLAACTEASSNTMSLSPGIKQAAGKALGERARRSPTWPGSCSSPCALPELCYRHISAWPHTPLALTSWAGFLLYPSPSPSLQTCLMIAGLMVTRSALPSLPRYCGTLPFLVTSPLPCCCLQQNNFSRRSLTVRKHSLPQLPLHFWCKTNPAQTSVRSLCYNPDRSGCNSFSVQIVPPIPWTPYAFDTKSPCLLTQTPTEPGSPPLAGSATTLARGLKWLQSPEYKDESKCSPSCLAALHRKIWEPETQSGSFHPFLLK